MLYKNGKIYLMKNIWQCCKQIWTHRFSVVTYYAVSYYRFLNTGPGQLRLRYFSDCAPESIFASKAEHQGPILQNTISAENFSDIFYILLKFWTKNIRYKFCHYYGQKSWILRVFFKKARFHRS
jgi:hypothetical protein